MAKVKKLRSYQVNQVNRLIRQLTYNNQAALVSAVGTGKTLVTAIVGSELISRDVVKKVIVSAPYNTIVDGFLNYKGTNIKSGSLNNQQYSVCEIERSQDVNHVCDIITGSNETFLVTSHHAMANDKVWSLVTESEDLSDILLVVDEAHHCFDDEDEESESQTVKDGTKLGKIANLILDRGGKIVYVSATPYRTYQGSTNLIFDPDVCKPIIRTIGEQMKDGLAPTAKTEYVHVKNFHLTEGKSRTIFGDGFTTSISDPQLKVVLPQIVEQYKKEQYPKTILLVPAGNAERTAKEVKKYLEQNIKFPGSVSKIRGRKFPSVLVQVGQDNIGYEVNGESVSAIEYDKNNAGKIYDIIVGCRKFDEGTDVSSASHLFMIGLPGSVRLFHQRVGRILRNKKEVDGYSEWFGKNWVEKSKVVFFAPVGGKTDNFDYGVGRQLLHCIFASESYVDYCNSASASQNIRIAFEKAEQNATTEKEKIRITDVLSAFSSIEIAELKDYTDISMNEFDFQILNPNMTVGERIEIIKASNCSENEKFQKIVNLFNQLPKDSLSSFDIDDIIERILYKKKQGKKFEVAPVSEMTEYFEEVLSNFIDVEIKSKITEETHKVFFELSGESLTKWAEQCGRYMGESYSISLCQKVIDFRNNNGKFPSTISKNQEEKKLGNWLSKMRIAKKGKGSGIFYPILDKMAKKSKFPNMFNDNWRED